MRELDFQNFVVEIASSRNPLPSIRLFVAHREPCPQHHIKSSVPQILGKADASGNGMIGSVNFDWPHGDGLFWPHV